MIRIFPYCVHLLKFIRQDDFVREGDPEFFSTDLEPDPAKLKKKFRIRPKIEIKEKIYLYFR